MDIQTLLEALEDEKVQVKIREIVDKKKGCAGTLLENGQFLNVDNSELVLVKESLQKSEIENEDLKKSIEELQSLLGSEKKAKEDANVAVQKLSAEVEHKDQVIYELSSAQQPLVEDKKRLESDVITLNQKLEFYRDNFRDDLQALELYDRLSEQTRHSLSGIFKDTSVQGLIACGIQEKNISNLWDYAKSETVNGNNDDIANVILLFNLLFKRFTLAYPMFSLQEAKTGDLFDTQFHIKHTSSINTSGSISQVMFYGYVNRKTGKVIKPSVVKL
ncbi:hypothetical protein [Photobacterium damselae]|uniref:hypothetical protein n=1 Tax=Photobacterium damselae TaxID=38293 RepID=UPI000D9226FE|nr:hypothetical protein [Photobacterium damselae]NVO75305.1 hypothetical protein [Photobacterium damselae subsp. damselae]SPY24594.1 Uncharacterised protein [Photobacterium damselae]